MGNSLKLIPGPISYIPFDQVASSQTQQFTIEEYQNFNRASINQKYFLISQIYPCFTDLFSSINDFSELIQKIFYCPVSFSSTLIINRSKLSQQIVGFTIINYLEIALNPNDNRNENKYIVVKGFSCILKVARGKGMQKELFIYRNKRDIEFFKDRNILLVDISINPLSYYVICQISKTLFPKYNEKTPGTIEEIFSRVMNLVEYENLGEDCKFLIKDNFTANESLLGNFRGNQDKFPEDIKFFNRTTGLRDHVGLGFVSVVFLVEGNTLGLKSGDYTVGDFKEFDLRSVNFDKPRI